MPTAESVPLADDEVALPVPRNGPVLDFGRALADHDHPRDAAPGLDAPSGAALGPPGAQAAGQLAAQLASALDEEGLVDRLVAHPHHRIVGKLEAQTHRDLLG